MLFVIRHQISWLLTYVRSHVNVISEFVSLACTHIYRILAAPTLRMRINRQ